MEKFGPHEQPLIVSHGGILAVMRPFLSFSVDLEMRLLFAKNDAEATTWTKICFKMTPKPTPAEK